MSESIDKDKKAFKPFKSPGAIVSPITISDKKEN